MPPPIPRNRPRPPHRRWPALALAVPLIAALAAACEKTTPPSPPGSAAPLASAAPSSSAAASSSAASAPGAPAGPHAREGGALARGVGEDVLYLADEDHKVVRRIPIPVDPQNLGVSVPLPGAPAAVLPLAGRVLVTVRDPGLLLIMKPDAEKGLIETARVELPADAWGVAVTPDEKTALVTSAWTHQLSAVDLGSAAKRWSIDLPREPRAVVVRADGAAAYVTHLTGAAVTRVDDLAGTPKTHPVELPPAPARAPSGKTIDASLAYAAVMNPEGTRLFVPRHALGALGQGSWFGAATVDVLATSNDTPVLGKRMSGLPMARHEVIVKMIDAGLVTNLDIAGADLTPVTQPRAVVYRRRTRTLLVAGEGDDRVAELDALSVAPAMKPLAIYKLAQDIDTALQIPNRGAAPTGLALSADERTLYVYCRATFDLATVALLEASTKADAGAPHAVTLARIADDPLPKEQAFGRRFFHNSTDQFVSGGLGCAGCHPEGRDDGHVWHEAKVMSQNESERTIFIGEPELAPNAKDGKIGYARQTPMLAGRAGFKGPYGWHAQNADLVERLKEGFGLHRWASAYKKGTGEVLARIHYLRAYVQNGLVPPPRPQRELTEGEKRGKEIFNSEAARCAKCHVPEPEYTDRMAYPLNPRLAPPPGFEEDPKSEFKTPSLRFVGGTPPYFHDGRFSTLEQLIDQNNDRMGKTNQLSKDDRAALIAFLRTL